MTLTQSDLIRRLRDAHGYSLLEARRAVHDVAGALTDLLDQLELGDRLMLRHLGRFECYLRKGGLRAGLHGRGPQILPDRPSLRFQPHPLRKASLAARLDAALGHTGDSSRPSSNNPSSASAMGTPSVPLEHSSQPGAHA
ncbi:MAG: hypothetical protein Q8M07_31525 [Prosthecobacter sp.]|nr:hypothetical protein [Prosthecobacter sp.]